MSLLNFAKLFPQYAASPVLSLILSVSSFAHHIRSLIPLLTSQIFTG
jgi:hypothetical protein